MTVYRLNRDRYMYDLSGRGAQITGGRWNSKGVAVLYTAQSRALAAIEIAVHIPLGIIPVDYYMTIIEIPDNAVIATINIADLPKNWNSNPFIKTTQKTGNDFIKNNKALVLRVPSATVRGDFNYLINPANSTFGKVSITGVERFDFDERLFKR